MLNYAPPTPMTPPDSGSYGQDDASLRLLLGGNRKVKRRPLPKLDDIREEAARVRQLNQLRNTAFQIRRDIVELSTVVSKSSRAKQTNRGDDDFVVRLSWPDSVLQEVINTFARVETYLNLEAEDDTEEAEEAAEKPKALLARMDECLEDEFTQNGGPQPLFMTMVQYAARDGCIAQRMCRRPNLDDPNGYVWDYELVDPMELYPVYIGQKFVRCYRISLLKVQDIRAQWGDTLLPDAKPEDDREVIAYYDDYYHAVFLSDNDEDWLKRPMPHEYEWGIPINIVYFRGYAGSRGDRQASMSDEQVEANRSRGIFDACVDELQLLARLRTAMTDRVMLTVQPPIVVTSEKGKAADVKVNRKAGGRTNLDEGEKVEEFPHSNADLQYITALEQGIVGALENATIPMQAMARHQSGWSNHVTQKQAATFFEPFLRGLKIALRWRSRAGLLCFRQFGDQIAVSGTSDRGKQFQWPFTPDMVPQDPRVIVEFSDLNELDRVQMLGALSSLWTSGGIDSLTAMGPEFLNLKNPHLIMERIREEQLWKNPGALQALIPSATIGALEKSLKDAIKRGRTLEAQVLKKQIEQMFMQIMNPAPQMPPMPPGMGGGGPPQGGMPPQIAALLGAGPQQGPAPAIPGANQGPPPMAAPNFLPPTAALGGADQLTPEIAAQRTSPRLPPGAGEGF